MKIAGPILLGIALFGCRTNTTEPARPEAVSMADEPDLSKTAAGAMLFDDLGTHKRRITTTDLGAQAYFDQGLRLLYAFNHDEAARSFATAALLDEDCAMCYWGLAYAVGPNYNVPMLPDRFALAWAALNKATAAAVYARPVERELIAALATRYSGPQPHGPEAQHPYDLAYANAMRVVANHYPADDDVQVLAAEALMDTNPWKLWSRTGAPAPQTEEILARLEDVLARSPNHPGANHYYIHAIEASSHPERGLPAARRLPGLMPGAGHTVHMPAHIYQRVGLYAEASAANRTAIAADREYLAMTKPPGYYHMYIGHNWGFLAYSASMEGRATESLQAAREAAKAIPPEMLAMMPGMDFFPAEPLLVMVRFGKWDDLLAEPRPDPRYHALTGLWLHAHGMALVAKGRVDEAQADLAELNALIARTPADEKASNNTTRAILGVGAKALEARIADARQDPSAHALWTVAVALEDGLTYAEPADWFYSLRHFQGASLLADNRPQEAEAAFRADLARHPRNGWALDGLAKALRAQYRIADAERAEHDRDVAWRNADTRPVRTAF
jgi:tetratricopeptide (TPR) repeat protein